MMWQNMHLMFWMSWIWTCVVGSFSTKNAQAREMQLWDSKMFNFFALQQIQNPMFLIEH